MAKTGLVLDLALGLSGGLSSKFLLDEDSVILLDEDGNALLEE